MRISEDDYIDIIDQSKKLGCVEPELKGIVLLPRNFESADDFDSLRHESTTKTVTKILRDEQLTVFGIEPEGTSIKEIEERHFDWIAPIIFVPDQLAKTHPFWISASLSALFAYLGKVFPKPQAETQQVKIELVVGPDHSAKYKKFSYEGPVDGLPEFRASLEAIYPNGVPE